MLHLCQQRRCKEVVGCDSLLSQYSFGSTVIIGPVKTHCRMLMLLCGRCGGCLFGSCNWVSALTCVLTLLQCSGNWPASRGSYPVCYCITIVGGAL